MSEIINYIVSKTGINTVEVNGYLLHSKYDPIKEADRIVEKEFKENFVHILFGNGLGYISNALKAKLKDKGELLIVEPFKEFLGSKNEDILFIEQREDINNKINYLLHDNRRDIKVICSPNYDKIAPEAYKELLKNIKDIQSLNIIEENTLRLASENWQENYIKNLLYASQDASISELYRAYNCPVIIASGGPSLTKQLPLLKKIKNSVILIASGSTINSLLKENIEPDYIVTIDGSEANYKHFNQITSHKASLLYSLSSNYKIQHEYKGKRYAFLPLVNNQVEKRIKEELNLTLPHIAGGGSVSTFAFTIAMYITTGPIALIGQDLAYTENLTHANNNKNQKSVDDSYFKKRNAFQVEGYFDDLVMTDYVFYSMKNSFEQIHKKIKHSASIFNCTEGGVKIKGFKQISFKNFADNYVEANDIFKVNSEKSTSKERLNSLFMMLNDEIKKYEQLESLCSEAIITLKKDKNKLIFSNNTLKKLDKIDNKSKEILNDVLMNDIIKPITMDVMRSFKEKENETPKEKFERSYNQNMLLYSQLLKATKISKKFTLEAVSTIKTEIGEL
ncbi:hypothetical protein LBYS11_03220 [Lysinibacillus sp. YS11]|uniref:motility associated factor glycosyltransferase family protein n=1 Tax=unclassified Lysinibacillus TaxID=2636778 RepID=UPI000CA3CD39|nr:6-hydroxymethylpterin diphosphokinase MptE-like protein [Lysinibacillus sp. YS11]AUS85398.1 hypothetical protein LBYS11_03220 [Lysinibacillus sp. YS11]